MELEGDYIRLECPGRHLCWGVKVVFMKCDLVVSLIQRQSLCLGFESVPDCVTGSCQKDIRKWAQGTPCNVVTPPFLPHLLLREGR